MPSTDVFDRQDAAYRESVLPRRVRRRVAIEAGVPTSGTSTSAWMARSSASTASAPRAPAEVLFPHFGFTVDAVVEAARATDADGAHAGA